MKKNLLFIVLGLFSLFFITGCGKNNSNDSIDLVGLTYKTNIGTEENPTYNYYEFKEAGVCEITLCYSMGCSYYDCEYTIENNYLTIIDDDNKKEKFKISDDKETITPINNNRIEYKLVN